MQVRDIMSTNPTCCSPETTLQDAAKMMADNDCGEIPVLDEQQRPIGVITDRDITCRGVAQGKDFQTQVRDIMSSPVYTTTPDTSLEDCCKTLEDHDIRRVPVVDENGACCGMLSQADIARNAPEHETAELIKDVSQPVSHAAH